MVLMASRSPARISQVVNHDEELLDSLEGESMPLLGCLGTVGLEEKKISFIESHKYKFMIIKAGDPKSCPKL